jgi:transmembrane sensor
MSQDRIEREAAEWLARRQQSDCSVEDQLHFDAWLSSDPSHQIAFWRLEYVDGRAELLSKETPKRAPRRQIFFRAGIAASLAALICSIGILGPFSQTAGATTYRTGIGGLQSHRLSDGSQVDLNTDTVIRTKISSASRSVWLEKGEAYFDIAPDKEHPFVVNIGKEKIVVVGTRFSVRRDHDRTRIDVEEGTVQIWSNGQKNASSNLRPGDIGLSQNGSVLLLPHSDGKIGRDLGWREGHLIFDQETLAEVASEFNRYNNKPLIVVGDARSIRIGGSFKAQDSLAFAHLLNKGLGLHVDESEDNIKIFQ